MLQVRQGFESLVRLSRKVKVTNPATVIKSGMCCKLDSNGEVVLTGSDASSEDSVMFAFDSANIADDINSGFKATGKITLLGESVFGAETDQYKKNKSVTGSQSETFAVVAGTSDKVAVRVDGGDVQTITLTAGGTRSAANIVSDLNNAETGLVGATASEDNGKVKIASDDTANGFIEIVYVANNAYTVLGLSMGTSEVGAQLASENGLLIAAETSDHVIARSLGTEGNGILKFITLRKSGVA